MWVKHPWWGSNQLKNWKFETLAFLNPFFNCFLLPAWTFYFLSRLCVGQNQYTRFLFYEKCDFFPMITILDFCLGIFFCIPKRIHLFYKNSCYQPDLPDPKLVRYFHFHLSYTFIKYSAMSIIMTFNPFPKCIIPPLNEEGMLKWSVNGVVGPPFKS